GEQKVDGGSDNQSDPTNGGKDVLILQGSANDFRISVDLQGTWRDTKTFIQALPFPSTQVFSTVDVEQVRFEDPVDNVVHRAGFDGLIELGTQIVAAYDESTAAAQTRNWHPVAAIELGMKPSNYQTVASPTGRYTFLDGVYEHITGVNDAVATVLSGVMDGKRTLSISIKG